MKASELKTGDEIQFFALPYGSYASTLTRYRIEVIGTHRKYRKCANPSIRLVNVATGSSTYDSLRAFRGASFEKLN